MKDMQIYDEYASATIQLKYEPSDEVCKEIEDALSAILRNAFDEYIMVDVYTDDHLLFVKCGMYSFDYAIKNADAISNLAQSETEKWIANAINAATEKVLEALN